MPQMAPMPWISIMLITFLLVLLVACMIYFYAPLSVKKPEMKSYQKFFIKW